jgi:transcriptional regulator with XRE-family HTH domain
MAKRTATLLPSTTELLIGLGERLRLARLRRGLSAKQVAERAGMSKMTLRGLERGGPGVTIGAYLSVMQVLGIEKDLGLVGKADVLGRELQDAKLPHSAKSPRTQIRSRKDSLPSPPSARISSASLKQLIQTSSDKQLRSALESFPTEQIRKAIDTLPSEQIRKSLEALPPEQLRKALAALPSKELRKTLESLPSTQLQKALEDSPSEHLSSWIGQSGFTSSEDLAKLLDRRPVTPSGKRH